MLVIELLSQKFGFTYDVVRAKSFDGLMRQVMNEIRVVYTGTLCVICPIRLDPLIHPLFHS